MSPATRPAPMRALRRTLSTPGYARMMFLRRFLALGLVIAAALSALNGLKHQPEVLVFARDVEAGTQVGAEDIESKRLPAAAVPEGWAEIAPEDVEGRILLAAASVGEVITVNRLLSDDVVNDLVSTPAADPVGNGTRSADSEGGHMLPISLAEPRIAEHLHHGDTVNIVAAPTGDAPAAQGELIAAGARVIYAGTTGERARDSNGAPSVLLALPEEQSQRVAAASLQQPLTVVIVGDRAHAGRG